MGTRSRIVIRRTRFDIYLWQHWDGYLEGVGADLCAQMKQLLEKYTIEQLEEMMENIEEGTEEFSTEKLCDMVAGKVNVTFDHCDDIQYAYVIDMKEGYVGVSWDGHDYLVMLPFELIKLGHTFEDIIKSME